MPITTTQDNSPNTAQDMARIVICGAIMICCSAGVINFNKYLISGPFPYAIYLVLGHMAFGSVFSLVLLTFVPSLFPSLTDSQKRVDVSLSLVLRKAFPIAIFYAGSLVLSNMAYLYTSVAFLQMMKQGNVVLVYFASLAFGLEVFSLRSICVLLFILVGTTMNIGGAVSLSFTGVLLQSFSQLFEVSRLLLQSMLLGGSGIKLDVLTYNLLVMPLCFCTLATVICLQGVYHHDQLSATMKAPSWQEVFTHRHLLLANMMLAFCLNVSIALFIKYSSAISMVLANVLKDVMVVLTSVMLLGEIVTGMQMTGFGVQLLGVFIWSMLKSFQKYFDNGIISGLHTLLLENSVNHPQASSPLRAKEPRSEASGSKSYSGL